MIQSNFLASLSRGNAVYFYDSRSFKIAEIETFLDSHTAQKLESSFSVQTALVLGGDGVFIDVAKEASKQNMPVFGVNFGTKGFFLHDMSALQKEAFSFEVQLYPILEVTVEIGEETYTGEAFNEIYLTRTAGAGSLRLSLSHARKVLGDVIVDGIMISTPAGTTGWSRNYGGHILGHHSATNLITPIGNRSISPIIVPDKGRIRIVNTAEREHAYAVLADNKIVVKEDTRPCTLTIERATRMVQVLVETDYLDTWEHKIYAEQGMSYCTHESS